MKIYAYRRKGLEYYCTCDEERYLELSELPKLFEVTTFYTEEQLNKVREDKVRLWNALNDMLPTVRLRALLVNCLRELLDQTKEQA